MLVLRWASVADGGPTYKQHWVNASCLCLWIPMQSQRWSLKYDRYCFHCYDYKVAYLPTFTCHNFLTGRDAC